MIYVLTYYYFTWIVIVLLLWYTNFNVQPLENHHAILFSYVLANQLELHVDLTQTGVQ